MATTLDEREQARKCGVDLDFEDAMLREWGGEDFEDLGGETAPVVVPPETVPQSSSNNNSSPSKVVDLEFENQMMQFLGTEVAESKGYFMPRSWLFDQEAEVLLRVDDASSSGGTLVHTFKRNGNNQAIVHDKHPYVAAIHLLRNASPNTEIYLPFPFVTDPHFLR